MNKRANGYLQGVGVLAFGVLLSQGISLAASPILTRIYDPESFGLLAIFLAVVSVFQPAAAGRYEVAIVVVKDRLERVRLFSLSLMVATITATALLMFCLIFHDASVLKQLGIAVIGHVLWLFPIAMLLSAIIESVRCLANAERRYGKIASIAVLQASVVAAGSIIVGIWEANGLSLILATIGGACATAIWALVTVGKEIKIPFSRIEITDSLNLAKIHRKFPQYNASASVLNSLSIALPVLLLAKFYSGELVGFYAIVSRSVMAPLSFISGSMARVHLKHVSDMVNDGQSSIGYHIKAFLFLSSISAIIVIFFVIGAPWLFAFCFGEEWRQAGRIAQIVIPMLCLRFIASTLSSTMSATGRMDFYLAWVGFDIVQISFVFYFFGGAQYEKLFGALAIGGGISAAVYLAAIFFAANRPMRSGINGEPD